MRRRYSVSEPLFSVAPSPYSVAEPLFLSLFCVSSLFLLLLYGQRCSIRDRQ